jgi:hypothetical protein
MVRHIGHSLSGLSRCVLGGLYIEAVLLGFRWLILSGVFVRRIGTKCGSCLISGPFFEFVGYAVACSGFGLAEDELVLGLSLTVRDGTYIAA